MKSWPVISRPGSNGREAGKNEKKDRSDHSTPVLLLLSVESDKRLNLSGRRGNRLRQRHRRRRRLDLREGSLPLRHSIRPSCRRRSRRSPPGKRRRRHGPGRRRYRSSFALSARVRRLPGPSCRVSGPRCRDSPRQVRKGRRPARRGDGTRDRSVAGRIRSVQ